MEKHFADVRKLSDMKLIGKRTGGFLRTTVLSRVCILATAAPTMAAELRAWVAMGPPLKYGTWSLMTGKVMNPAKNEINGVLVVMADSASDVQFSTPIWAPPESRVQAPLPFITESRDLLGMS